MAARAGIVHESRSNRGIGGKVLDGGIRFGRKLRGMSLAQPEFVTISLGGEAGKLEQGPEHEAVSPKRTIRGREAQEGAADQRANPPPSGLRPGARILPLPACGPVPESSPLHGQLNNTVEGEKAFDLQ